MPFGIFIAPTTLMGVMNDIFRQLIDDFLIVYLDDILIFSENWEDNVMHVRKVLDVLRKEKLFLKMLI
jgi:hypothetical protein